ncbi:MAG: hypothetical protein HY975_02520 [Candidatus Kerfeldbacteria bacterium]|nr:hypothetical protein [Candidatus Kerfeldbacteria bacterium]
MDNVEQQGVPESARSWEAPTEELADASPEALEARENELRGEIAEGVEELSTNVEQIETLATDPEATPTMRERLLASIDRIANRVQQRFVKQLGGSAALGGVLGLQEYLMNSGNSPIMQGSLISRTNEVALAAVAAYASIKGLQFVGHKLKELGARHALDKGTVGSASDVASYISNERYDLDMQEEPLSSIRDTAALFKDSLRIFDEENVYPKEYLGEKEQNARWKKAIKRLGSEASELLAS